MKELNLLKIFLLDNNFNRIDSFENKFRDIEHNSLLYGKILDLFNGTNMHKSNNYKNIVQIGGTGGDTLKTINVSTLAAMTVASMGYKIIKTGSGSFTGKMGSADFFLKMVHSFGMNKCLLLNPDNALKKFNFFFSRALIYYPWLSKIHQLKKIFSEQLFNELFENMDRNEMNSKIKIDGISSYNVSERLEHYIYYHYKKVLILHGATENSELYLDEASNIGETHVAALINGKIYRLTLLPEDFRDKKTLKVEDMVCNGRREIYKSDVSILRGNGNDGFLDIVVINAAIYINFINNFKLNLKKLYKEIKKHISEGLVINHFLR